MQREQEAFELLEQAVQRFPEDADIRLLYASSLLAFRPNDVSAEAAKAVELGLDDPMILVRAAHLMLGRGNVENARSSAARAKKLVTPDFQLYPEVLNLDGHFAVLDGNDELAEESFQLALEHEPTGALLAVDLAKFLAARDRRQEALDVIDETLTLTKDKESLQRLREDIVGRGAGAA